LGDLRNRGTPPDPRQSVLWTPFSEYSIV